MESMKNTPCFLPTRQSTVQTPWLLRRGWASSAPACCLLVTNLMDIRVTHQHVHLGGVSLAIPPLVDHHPGISSMHSCPAPLTNPLVHTGHHHHLLLPVTWLSSLASGLSKSSKLVLPCSAPPINSVTRFLSVAMMSPRSHQNHLTVATS